MLQNILFVKDCLSENAPGSFNDKLHPSKVPLNHTTRSSSTYQLKVNNFKTERYGRKSIVNKCTLDWNKLQKILEQNFQTMKRLLLKTVEGPKRLKMRCKYFLFPFFSCPFSLSSSSLIFLYLVCHFSFLCSQRLASLLNIFLINIDQI